MGGGANGWIWSRGGLPAWVRVPLGKAGGGRRLTCGPYRSATTRKGEEAWCGVAYAVTGLWPSWLAGPRAGHGEEKGNIPLLGYGEEKGMGQRYPGEREVRRGKKIWARPKRLAGLNTERGGERSKEIIFLIFFHSQTKFKYESNQI